MTREEAIEVYNGLLNQKIKEAFEFFAPELAESEDEKTRKSLLAYIKGESKRLDTPKWIAYLEKQKEQKPAWSEEDKKLLNYAISMTDDAQVKRFLKSLRPSWKPNDKDEERLIKTSIVFLKDFADMGYENAVECIDWLKSKLNGNTCK